MPGQLYLRNKRRVVPFVCEEKMYRTVLTFDTNGRLFDLYVEYVPGKDAGTPPREISAGKPNAGIEEIKKRYAKWGAQAVVKNAVILNAEKQVVARFALKCFYRNQSIRVTAFAEKECEAWRFFGEQAFIFFRDSSNSLMANAKVYLLMPWIEGKDFYELFSSRESAMLYGLSLRLQMLNQLFVQLQLIGKAGKVFSDFKPENIMYDVKRRKIFLVDVTLADNGSRPAALTSAYVEEQKIDVYRKTGVITYDWQDQMYAFGLIAAQILTNALSLQSDRELGKALSAMISAVFCNPIREKRPLPSQGFYEALAASPKESAVRISYRNNPYGSRLFSVSSVVQTTGASESGLRLENRPT